MIPLSQDSNHLELIQSGDKCHNLMGVQLAIRLEEVKSVDEILSLEPDWEGLVGAGGRCAPFVQPAYVALWLKVLGKVAEPRAITAWKGRSLIGYAPFMLTTDNFGPFSVATLKFIGNNTGLPGDVLYGDIVAPEPPEEVVRAILSHVRAKWELAKWDLGFLHPSSPTNRHAREILNLGEDDARFLQAQPYVRLDLPSDWDAYVRGLTRNTRQSFRRQVRKLEDLGSVQTRVDREPERVSLRVRELMGNHERYWKGTPKEGWFGDEEVHRFLASAAKLLAGRGQFIAFTLELDSTPIAWNVGAFDGSRYFEQMLSFDRSHAALSPGMVLSVSLIRQLLRAGGSCVELGPGFDQRKQRLGGVPTDYPRLEGYLGWARWIARFRRLWIRRSMSS